MPNCCLCEECHSVFLHPLSFHRLTAFYPPFVWLSRVSIRGQGWITSEDIVWGHWELENSLRKLDVGLGKPRIETSSFSFVLGLYERWSETLPPKSFRKPTPHVLAENAPKIGVQITVIILCWKSRYLKGKFCDFKYLQYFLN